jgi:hypothetical protein
MGINTSIDGARRGEPMRHARRIPGLNSEESFIFEAAQEIACSA